MKRYEGTAVAISITTGPDDDALPAAAFRFMNATVAVMESAATSTWLSSVHAPPAECRGAAADSVAGR